MKVLPLLFLVCGLFLDENVTAENPNEGGCDIENTTIWRTKPNIFIIDDDQLNVEVFSSKYKEPLNIDKCTASPATCEPYTKVYINDTNFAITTTNDLKNIDHDTPKSAKGYRVSCVVTCPLKCKLGTTVLSLLFYIRDNNENPPIFTEKEYIIEVPSPIMPKTDISVYASSPIQAEDEDFTNQNVIFKVDPDDFSITTSGDSTSKYYRAIFSARRVMVLSDDKTYSITATDSGEPPLTGTAKLTLKASKHESMDAPTFEKTLYSFYYTEEDDNPKLSPKDGTITLKTDKPDGIKSLSIEGDLKHYITPTFDKEKQTVSLNLQKKIEEASAFVFSSLNVKTDTAASTTIVVYLSSDDRAAPKFKRVFYTGKYDPDSNKVNLDDNEVIQIDGNGPITCSVSAYREYISIVAEQDHYIVKVSDRGLPSELLQQQKDLLLQMKATSSSGIGFATLDIKMPTAPQFDRSSYTTYYDSATNSVPGDFNITVTTENQEKVDVELGSDYHDYFSLKSGAVKNTYNIVVNKKLPSNILSEQKAIVLTIIAKAKSVKKEVPLVLMIQGNSDSSSGTSKTPYVVAISTLTAALVVVIVGGALFYYIKLRRRMSATPNVRPTEKRVPSIPNRPDQYMTPRYVPQLPEQNVNEPQMTNDKTDDESPVVPKGRKKSVVFDLGVREMTVEPMNDEETDKSDTASQENSDTESRSNGDVEKRNI